MDHLKEVEEIQRHICELVTAYQGGPYPGYIMCELNHLSVVLRFLLQNPEIFLKLNED